MSGGRRLVGTEEETASLKSRSHPSTNHEHQNVVENLDWVQAWHLPGTLQSITRANRGAPTSVC